MFPSFKILLAPALLLSLAPAPFAQTLTLPAGESAGTREQAPAVPPSGMRMQDVERRFGPPLQRSDPVGDPPILVWRYEGFRVYFEYDRVISSVTDKSVENGVASSALR